MPASYHVVIADDNAAMRSLLVRAITRIYSLATISAFMNGQEALAACQQQGADLVITNFEMPVMSGLVLTQRLRMLSSSLPIIMISSDPTAEPRARAAGVSHFLLKPFTIAELVRIVTGLLPP